MEIHNDCEGYEFDANPKVYNKSIVRQWALEQLTKFQCPSLGEINSNVIDFRSNVSEDILIDILHAREAAQL